MGAGTDDDGSPPSYGLDADDTVDAFIAAATAILDAQGVQAAVIGGIARNLHAEPRTTQDADFGAVVDDAQAYAGLVHRMREAGFILRSERSEPTDNYPTIAQFEAPALRVDVLIAKTEFEHRAIESAVTLDSTRRDLRVVRAEDLIIYKLLAGRSKDFADIEAVIDEWHRRGENLDWIHIDGEARVWGVLDRMERARAYERSVLSGLGR